MKREYLDRSVYDAVQDRFDYLFQEFENIYVSFSGGKDSGLLLNLLMDYKRAHYPHRVIGLFHQDFEAQYTVTTEYVTRTFERLLPEVAPYWVVFLWPPVPPFLATRCSGILGMIAP